MKKFIATLLICAMLSLSTGCGDTKVIEGKEYDTYGLLNANNNKNPDIEYRVIVGNVIWSIILMETIVFPIYFIGFSLFEPVGKANPDESHKGVIN